MDIIAAFIGWKSFRKAQTSVAQAKQAFVDGLVIRMVGKPGLRGLGKRYAQEPGCAAYANPSEGCIVKMGLWRGTTNAAKPKPTARIVCDLVLHYEGFKRRSEGERLVGERDNERAK
jgi:hypothetical protein